MRKVAFALAFLIFTNAHIAEAPYTPIWDAPKYSRLIELQTKFTPLKRDMAKLKAHVKFLELHDTLNRAEKAKDKKEQAEELRRADSLQHLGYRYYLNSIKDFEIAADYVRNFRARDI
jgi:hypothetical protein